MNRNKTIDSECGGQFCVYADMVERGLNVANLDENQDEAGYSIDACVEMFDRGLSVGWAVYAFQRCIRAIDNGQPLSFAQVTDLIDELVAEYAA